MKDWKTYAIAILSAWCAWLTYFPINDCIERRERIRKHEEWRRTKGTELDRKIAEQEAATEEAQNRGRELLERIKKDHPEIEERRNKYYSEHPEEFIAMTNRMAKSFPRIYERKYGGKK